MLHSVLGKSLWDQRRGIVAWSIGLAAIAVLYAAFYPVINTPAMREYIEVFPKGILDAMGITDFTSSAGYVGSTSFGFLGATVAIIFATVLGSRIIAGDEEAGRLDVLLAHPIERWRFVVERAGAMAIALGMAGVVLFATMAVVAGAAQFDDIGLANLAAASLQLVLLALLFGSLALFVGALTGRRALAAGVVVVVAVASYFANTLGPSVEWLAWTRDLSPFRYFSGGAPLRNGLPLGDALVLAVASVILVGLAAATFRRRDIAV